MVLASGEATKFGSVSFPTREVDRMVGGLTGAGDSGNTGRPFSMRAVELSRMVVGRGSMDIDM